MKGKIMVRQSNGSLEAHEIEEILIENDIYMRASDVTSFIEGYIKDGDDGVANEPKKKRAWKCGRLVLKRVADALKDETIFAMAYRKTRHCCTCTE